MPSAACSECRTTTPAFERLPAIFLNYTAPVVRHAADGERELVLMTWGFPLLQPGKAPRRVTNVRDDKILMSSFWRPSFEERRCLVPASSFCERDPSREAVAEGGADVKAH